MEAGVLKSFDLSRFERIEICQSGFKPDTAMLERVLRNEGIWFGGQEMCVELRVAPPVAHYFQRQAVLPSQRLVSQDEDGSLHLQATVVHPDQILPIVRQWIPHLEIMAPPQLRSALHVGLTHYLDKSAPAMPEKVEDGKASCP